MRLPWPPDTISRIAVGIAALVVLCLMGLDYAFGLVPNPARVEIDRRQAVSQLLGDQIALVATRLGAQDVHQLLYGSRRNEPKLLGMALRSSAGEVVSATGIAPPRVNGGDFRSTSTHVRVPVMLQGQPWGALELNWAPIAAESFPGMLLTPQALWPLMSFLGLVVLHLGALHEVGSNNPDGVEIKKLKDGDGKPLDGIPFHPYYTVKDMFGAGFFLIVFASVIFFNPTFGGLFLEHDNFVQANALVTPEHIKPVWYFTPYYAMLRAIPDKLMGVVVMGAATLILFILPWIDRSPVKSIRYRGVWSKLLLAAFIIAFIILGWLGSQSPTELQTLVARICTFIYFAFFPALYFVSAFDKVKPVPERVTMHD